MSRLIVKLLLSIAAFPVSVVTGFLAYLILALTLSRGVFGSMSDYIIALLVVMPLSLMALTFLGFWLLIWRRSIRWTGFRRTATICVAIGSVVVPVAVMTLMISSGSGDPAGAISSLVLYMTSIPLQLALVWRSSRREEADRLAEWRLDPTPRCPYCQGMLAGRMGARCCHCGGDLRGDSVPGAIQ